MSGGPLADWTTSEISRLREVWPDMSLTFHEIGERVGRSSYAVRDKGRSLGLPKRKFLRSDAPRPVPAAPPAVVAPPVLYHSRGEADVADRREAVPIIAPADEVAAWAEAQGLRFRGWEDLHAVNLARDPLLLPWFAKPLRCHGRRVAA